MLKRQNSKRGTEGLRISDFGLRGLGCWRASRAAVRMTEQSVGGRGGHCPQQLSNRRRVRLASPSPSGDNTPTMLALGPATRDRADRQDGTSARPGNFSHYTKMSSADTSRFYDALNANIWDPRADMDDDGDVDATDETLYLAKYGDWSGFNPPVTVAQAFSDVGNPFMFQGVPHFALDTAAAATSGKLLLNHHRARFADPVTGRWTTRDPLSYSLNTLDPAYLDLRASAHLVVAMPYEIYFLVMTSTPQGTASEEEIPIENPRVYDYLENCPANESDLTGLCTAFLNVQSCYNDAVACVQARNNIIGSGRIWNLTRCTCGPNLTPPCCFTFSFCAGVCPEGPTNGPPGTGCMFICTRVGPGPVYGCECR